MKYGLEIKVRADGSSQGAPKGAGRREDMLAGKRTPKLQELVAQAQDVKKSSLLDRVKDKFLKRGEDGKAPDKNMAAVLGKLDRSITVLNREISALRRTIEKMGKGGGGEGGEGSRQQGFMRRMMGRVGLGGGGGRDAGGGAMGAMGSAIPFVGAVLGALAFGFHQIMSIGRAAHAKRMEQAETWGVAGMQTSGRYTGVFNAASWGAYIRERRMAAGRMGVGNAAEYPVGGSHEHALRTHAPWGIRMAAVFGGAPEFARAAGMLDIFRPSGTTGATPTGETVLSNIIRGTFRGGRGGAAVRGIGTEMPLLIREMTSAMEEAVRNGVNASDLASDMAAELVDIARSTPGGQIRSAMQIQQNLSGVQAAAARGQGGGVEHFQMMMTARNLLTANTPEGAEARRRLMESGMLTSAQAAKLERGEMLPPEEMMFAAQALNETQSGAVRAAFVRAQVGLLGGEGTRSERLARFHRIAQTMFPSLSLTPQQSTQLFDWATRRNAADKYNALITERTTLERGLSRGELTGTAAENARRRLEEIARELRTTLEVRDESGNLVLKTVQQIGEEMAEAPEAGTQQEMESMLETGESGRASMAREGMLETQLFSEAATAAMAAMVDLEESLINLANALSGPVTQGINLMSTAITGMVDAANSVAEFIRDAIKAYQERRFGQFIRDLIF